MAMFTDSQIKNCYNQMLQRKVEKQKQEVDNKCIICKQEIERRSKLFKSKVVEEAKRQIASIDENTEDFKRMIDEEAERQKQFIENTLYQRQQSEMLDLDDLKELLSLLTKRG